MVKNSYDNIDDRHSFYISIFKCNKEFQTCESDENIQKVVDSIFFSFSYIGEVL
jgi:hypothetical protein